MKLSILIPTTRTRYHFLQRILGILLPQINGDTQLLIDADDGDVSIGVKRQRMLDAAVGEYVVFVDDDDIVSENYVGGILKAMASKPDFVRLKFFRSVNGANRREWVLPEPFHINPVRRELALRVGYPDRAYGEDNDHAEGLRGIVGRSEAAEGVWYEYAFRSDRTGEKMHAAFDALTRSPA